MGSTTLTRKKRRAYTYYSDIFPFIGFFFQKFGNIIIKFLPITNTHLRPNTYWLQLETW